MSNFEELVYRTRKAQIQYAKNPTRANRLTKEVNEEDLDAQLDFIINCPSGGSFADVREWLKNRR